MKNWKSSKTNLSITYINIYNGGTKIDKSIHLKLQQRAEGGGQILKDVGYNASQGGHFATNLSQSSNRRSQFANGNGRSGIAGHKNDEQGGQSAVKLRKSKNKSKRG
ncbi:hypothetical protein ACFO9Q_15505 [Paenibacillus sp. GCM10023252]|uniref:hypothetical protein n=1 Tax=Paenibacillus sp. GCM10023252 TaxID=3252649 RepID=UPI00360D8EDB